MESEAHAEREVGTSPSFFSDPDSVISYSISIEDFQIDEKDSDVESELEDNCINSSAVEPQKDSLDTRAQSA